MILMSHLGRPDGHVVDKYSLKPVVRATLPALLRYQLSPLPQAVRLTASRVSLASAVL